MSIDGWTDEDVVHIYNKYYSAFKKNEIMPFAATWMDLQTIILGEVNRTKTNMISLIRRIWKNDTSELTTEQRETHRLRELMFTRGEGIDWEFGTDMYTLIFKIDKQQGPMI